ncbi:palmitoyltransferase PFA4 [Cryptococcus neoformans Bt1]|nr:palmitoyltransferase PFA4 [Cryptococcus neoformans var. grubii Bt1]OXG31683.1 palmitoyltransferase PFA4 [Cryptococcus neoformans var. grubii Ze90-1]
MAARNWSRVWVGGTVILISFIAFSSQIFVIWPWYGREISLDLLKLLVPLNLAAFMIFWNYRLCVITSPGTVPEGWRPNIGAMDGMEVKKGTHTPRYCKNCAHYKPPRGGASLQAVQNMLDHCPWIGNCVGFYNQGHFIRFLLWVDIGTTFHLIIMVRRVLYIAEYYHEPTLADVLFLVFNFATCVPVWLCVGMFSIYHVYLACGNSTTIEGWEKDKVATLIRRGKIKEVKYPYNIGIYKNIKSVLGPNPLLWLWPQKMQGDGLSFPVNPSAGDHMTQYFWPPQDPSRLPNPPPIPAHASPFVYGNNGFNPNLRPTNSLRARRSSTPRIDEDEYSHEQSRHYSSGDERDNGSISASSSPEPYLSDYDHYDEGPMYPGERMTTLVPRVRRGSEGWEVAPGGGWNAYAGMMDEEVGWDDEAGYDEAPGEDPYVERPWEMRGRYNVYDPEEESGYTH